MKYNIETSELMTDEDAYLKTLNCPLNKHWESLVPNADSYLKRRCNECNKFVIDISTFSDDQVQAIVEIDPDACFHIRSDAPNIEFIGNESPHQHQLCVQYDGKYRGCRIILTARSLGEINSPFKESGHHPLVEFVEENSEIRQKIEIRQNEKTGEIYLIGDYRGMGDPGNEYWFHPRTYTSPIAAYIVPNDIDIGEKVYIPDLIEEHVGSRWNQGDTYKLESAFAIWNGEDFDFEIDEPAMMIG